jgi:hypothetical protein
MKKVHCPIPWCLLYQNPRLSDLAFLKNHLHQKHSSKERSKVASILGYPNYADGNSNIDYLTIQGIVGN